MTHLKNFIHEVAMSLAHRMRKTPVHTGFVLGFRLFTNPTLAVEFEPKELVLGLLLHQSITLFHQFVYRIPVYFGTKALLKDW